MNAVAVVVKLWLLNAYARQLRIFAVVGLTKGRFGWPDRYRLDHLDRDGEFAMEDLGGDFQQALASLRRWAVCYKEMHGK